MVKIVHEINPHPNDNRVICENCGVEIKGSKTISQQLEWAQTLAYFPNDPNYKACNEIPKSGPQTGNYAI